LKEKKQSEFQKKQPYHAVLLFYEINSSASGKNSSRKDSRKTTSQQHKTIVHKTSPGQGQDGRRIGVGGEPSVDDRAHLKSAWADWTLVYNDLKTAIELRHYSPKTLRAYRGWTRQFQGFTKSKDPQLISIADVKDFLSFLAVEQNVSASSQNQAFNALLFLFRHVFGKEFGKVDGIVRAKRKPYIPVVLSREEVDKVVGLLKYPYDLIVKLLYGCGLRISECINFRVHNFNFDAGILTVHDGKGQKDRTVPLPEVLEAELKRQMDAVIEQHRADLDSGYAGVFLYGLLEKNTKTPPGNWSGNGFSRPRP
jgi:integrase